MDEQMKKEITIGKEAADELKVREDALKAAVLEEFERQERRDQREVDAEERERGRALIEQSRSAPPSKQRELIKRFTKLAGGFSCMLTCEEQNAWKAFLFESVGYEDYLKTKALLLTEIHEAESGHGEVKQRVRDALMSEQILFEMAKHWHEQIAQLRKPRSRLAALREERDRRSSDTFRMCGVKGPHGYMCTAPMGHPGVHIASLVTVGRRSAGHSWPNEQEKLSPSPTAAYNEECKHDLPSQERCMHDSNEGSVTPLSFEDPPSEEEAPQDGQLNDEYDRRGTYLASPKRVNALLRPAIEKLQKVSAFIEGDDATATKSNVLHDLWKAMNWVNEVMPNRRASLNVKPKEEKPRVRKLFRPRAKMGFIEPLMKPLSPSPGGSKLLQHISAADKARLTALSVGSYGLPRADREMLRRLGGAHIQQGS